MQLKPRVFLPVRDSFGAEHEYKRIKLRKYSNNVILKQWKHPSLLFLEAEREMLRLSVTTSVTRRIWTSDRPRARLNSPCASLPSCLLPANSPLKLHGRALLLHRRLGARTVRFDTTWTPQSEPRHPRSPVRINRWRGRSSRRAACSVL